MAFERILENTTEDLSDAKTVGLAMYYLLEEEGQDNVRPAEIRNFLKDQPVSIAEDHIAAYPSQLKSKGFFDSTDGDYILTIDGKRYYNDIIELPPDEQEPRGEAVLQSSASSPLKRSLSSFGSSCLKGAL